jgi:hypothetical protein
MNTRLWNEDMLDLMFDCIGHIGVFLFVSAFFLLQREVLRSDDLRYLGMNLVGAILLMISLMWTWNLPAFVLELFWLLISVYGIIKTLRKRGIIA